MNNTIQIRTILQNKVVLILFFVIVGLVVGRQIASGSYTYLLFLIFSGFVLFLFFKEFEFFLLLLIIINQEFFYLLPPEMLGGRQYQGLLYVILVITGGWHFFRKEEQYEVNFNRMIIFFIFLVILGVFTSFFFGQPLILGIKAAKSYSLLLFYFVFLAKNINMEKFFRLIVITGVLLTLLNNLQYIFPGSISIFYFFREMERVGQMRFLIGDFFMIFSPIIAFGGYLTNKKKWYLAAFIYMASTVVIQGQTRAIIWGFTVTLLLLLYFAEKLNFIKVVFVGVPLLVLSVWFLPIIQSTFFGELYNLTRYEIQERRGNVQIRLDTYKYYFGEILKSPIIGRGIWNDEFKENNPEDMKYRGLHIGDIGITRFIFHFGLVGVFWLSILFIRVYKTMFISLRKLKENIHFGLIGYCIFSIATMATLNCFVGSRSIIYLTLVLALLSQLINSEQELEKSL